LLQTAEPRRLRKEKEKKRRNGIEE
jgi:hypothetical protein